MYRGIMKENLKFMTSVARVGGSVNIATYLSDVLNS